MMPGGTDGAPENLQHRLWDPPSWHTLCNGLTCSDGTVHRQSCRIAPAFFLLFCFPPRSTAVASNTSKTARASVRAGQAGAGGALSVLGEYKYLIPLANGRFAYVRNLTNGKTTHL